MEMQCSNHPNDVKLAQLTRETWHLCSTRFFVGEAFNYLKYSFSSADLSRSAGFDVCFSHRDLRLCACW